MKNYTLCKVCRYKLCRTKHALDGSSNVRVQGHWLHYSRQHLCDILPLFYNTTDSAGAGHAGSKGQTGELELHQVHVSLGLAATRTEGAQSGPAASHVPGSVRRGRQ